MKFGRENLLHKKWFDSFKFPKIQTFPTEVKFVEQCPKCGVWLFEVDPRTETEKCYNCGYERKIKDIKEYYRNKDVTYKLTLISHRRLVNQEEAFYFCFSLDQYTGESAASLKEFAMKIKEIDIESLEFHFQRGDFEKWIIGIFRDKKLAEEISNLRKKSSFGESLRNQLHNIILTRSREMKIKS